MSISFWDRISCSPGWPPTLSILKSDWTSEPPAPHIVRAGTTGTHYYLGLYARQRMGPRALKTLTWLHPRSSICNFLMFLNDNIWHKFLVLSLFQGQILWSLCSGRRQSCRLQHLHGLTDLPLKSTFWEESLLKEKDKTSFKFLHGRAWVTARRGCQRACLTCFWRLELSSIRGRSSPRRHENTGNNSGGKNIPCSCEDPPITPGVMVGACNPGDDGRGKMGTGRSLGLAR